MRVSILFFLLLGFSGALRAQDSASSVQGSHKELETDAGELRVGISNLDSDSRRERTTGVAEIGYVIRGEYDQFNPKSLALIPFFRNHFESDEAGHQAAARSGVGIDLQFAKVGKSSRLVLRATADESDPYRGRSDDGISTSIGAFLQTSFGGVDEENHHARRLRRLIEPYPIEMDLSEEFLTQEITTDGERAEFHFLVVSLYILRVRVAKAKAKISDYDPFLDPESSADDRYDWLYEHLGDRYPLHYIFPRENGVLSIRASSYHSDDDSLLLSPRVLIDDFDKIFENQEDEILLRAAE